MNAQLPPPPVEPPPQPGPWPGPTHPTPTHPPTRFRPPLPRTPLNALVACGRAAGPAVLAVARLFSGRPM